MSMKKIIVAGLVLASIGAIAAVSAPGPRGFGSHHDRSDWHNARGGDQDMRHGRWFGGDLDKETFDTRTRERFAGLDKNSDGSIDAAEIEASLTQRRAGMMGRFAGRRRDGDGASGGGERHIQRFDTNRDGKATRDEVLAAARKRFADADLNNDGKLSDDDLPPMMRGQGAIERLAAGTAAGGHRGRGAQMGHGGPMSLGGLSGLGAIDVKDGAITLDAALAATARMFDRFDRNKDAAIDKADLEALRKDMTDYGVKRFIHAHGADKDGKVSREQFFAKSAERFAAMDLNGDGKISRGEHGGGWRGGRHGRDGHGLGGRSGGMGDRDDWSGEGRQGPPKQ